MAGGVLFVQVGSDPAGDRVLALDPATGDEIWSWSGVGTGYASPIAIEVERQRQLVTLTESSLVGLDATNGVLHWSVPFTDEWHENIVTPVWTGAYVVVSGPRQGTHAFAIRRQDNRWQAARAWSNAGVTMYMSSPVLDSGTLYGHSSTRSGQFVALDAATGAVRWAGDASPASRRPAGARRDQPRAPRPRRTHAGVGQAQRPPSGGTAANGCFFPFGSG